ncbi:hypothetical protein [Absidia glauca]|uniref:BHLH domain-containing protein n=1 Tax=Absidia glauca TaxID=4829 RepID=A0A163J5Q2_ABSGL|nr:hypothetical protein [Absidia glauca]
MNKFVLGSSLDYYPQCDDSKIEDTTSATMYSDTSFYPMQLNYGLPNSPDSYVSIKTPISPSAALCTMNIPTLMEPSSSLLLPTNAPAVSATIPASDYLFNETQSTSYSSYINTANIQQPQQSDQLLSHHYSHQNEDRTQAQLQHLLQPYYRPRKKTRRQSITSGVPSSAQQDNTQFMITTPYSPRSPAQTASPALQKKKTSAKRPMEEIDSTEPGSSLENESITSSSSSPTSFDLIPRPEDQSAHEKTEYEHSGIVLPLASSSATTSANSDTAPFDNGGNNTTEIRRQIHIQSEQKRRAQIKCGFEDLRNELPVSLNKKMSKVTLLHRTIQHIQHLKSTQMTILTELERLVQENKQLKRFQQSALQKQVMDSIYPSQ